MVLPVLSLLAVLFAVGCASTDSMPESDMPVATVAVYFDDSIKLDGKTVTMAELDLALTDLAAMDGGVMFYREAVGGMASANAVKAYEAIVSKGLPVRLSTKEDFSDYVGPAGKSRKSAMY